MSDGKALLRRQITCANRILNFVKNTKEKKSQKIQTEVYIQGRIELLDHYWKEFYSRHNELIEFEESLAEDDYFKFDLYSTVEEEFLCAKATLTVDLRQLKSVEGSDNASANQESAAQVLNNGFTINSTPSLTVPKFSGKQRDWETFKALYCSIIKNNPKLSSVVKLQYLINSLEGPAAQRLKGINIVGTNLEVAWEKLLRRYDNPRIRLADHLDKIIYAKPVKHKSPSEINRLIDVVEEAIQGLRDLQCPIEQWDPWFVHLITQKLDYETREAWEITQENVEGFSSYKDLNRFLEKRVRSFEQANFEGKLERNSNMSPKQGNIVKSKQIYTTAARSNFKRREQSCILCKGGHSLGFCARFRDLTIAARKDFVQRNKLCVNCLRQNHAFTDCHITSRCLICSGKHHTKLHEETPNINQAISSDVTASTSSRAPGDNEAAASFTSLTGKTVLLATAQVILKSDEDFTIKARALLDPAAERSFISESLANLLSLKRKRVNVPVTGVGGIVTAVSSGTANLTLHSNFDSSFCLKFPALILNKLTSFLPNKEVVQSNWPHIKGLQLADPVFYKPQRVDVILGADVYATILENGVKRGPRGTPVAQETALGWILTGHTATKLEDSSDHAAAFQTSLQPDTSEMLSKLWELEELPSQPQRSPDDVRCEELFRKTVHRKTDGRYVVKLPLFNTPHFPGSRAIAISAFLKAESRRQSNEPLRIAYIHFMEEYARLGHMVEVPRHDIHKPSYYMPHHAVIRNDGTQKLRVVFNASRRCSTGYSLNDFLKTGPKLQLDLPMILTRWRFYKFVFCADIVKMFRQILVKDDDADYQRILWRSDPAQPIKDYKLTTVTYGTASAPYLAIRTLLQLAEDEEQRFPEGSAILRHQTYVDDIFSGGDTIEDSLKKRNQIIGILETAGFPLGKWSSNSIALLDNLQSYYPMEKAIEPSDLLPILGIKWSPKMDFFSFRIDQLSTSSVVTKRTILSQVARLFDPLGWLSPVLINAKILLQDLWIAGIDWDTPITGKHGNTWSLLTNQLLELQHLKIPRWFGTYSEDHWQLHGFSDASERAYAAAVYYRQRQGTAKLIFAKAKVAPIKTISLPRLELCGALLLARVISYILSELSFKPNSVHCWTDSQVVLCWLKGHPSNWKSFVANRVSEILEKCPFSQWHHVKSADNPADCATRGYTSEKLCNSQLWWNGPRWISLDPQEWPSIESVQNSTDIERKSKVLACNSSVDESFLHYFERFSSYSKVIRILAYCGRWRLPSSEKKRNWLTTAELTKAKTVLWKIVQQEYFMEDINRIRKGKTLTPGHFLIGSSLLFPPSPFVEVDLNQTFSSRWKQITCMRNAFWRTWRKEVLNHMQQRSKWLKPIQSLKIGDIVLIKDEIAPPTKWPMGRIIALHPGRDGLVRVATVKTADTEYQRPLIKLIPLPVDSSASNAASIGKQPFTAGGNRLKNI